MSPQRAPRGMRLHIGLFGRRNAGKSSLLNALTGQQVAIVSEQAGTTTDPVERPMELQPLGPVVFIDTAGVDDEGDLGEQRVARSMAVLERTDLALLVAEAGAWGEHEEALLSRFAERGVPVVVALSKVDRAAPDAGRIATLRERGWRVQPVSSSTGEGLGALRSLLLEAAPADWIEQPALLGDLLPPGGLVVMVVPIDKEAPKGRLILPQVQSLRDALDHDALCLVTKERELRAALARLSHPPDLVVTDSQAFSKVAADTPPGVPLTSFSMLFARYRGDLLLQVQGALAVDSLRSGDRVLIAESCTHHPIGEDIGRVKIPRWLAQYTGLRLELDHVAGRDFPDDLSPYSLVIHCGGCMTNRRAMLSRLHRCREAGVPVSNYGVIIAHSLGILRRALEPFPAARLLLDDHPGH
jgi:[FeFe] hydrogenase H-cluster maturation GTPase HydF